MPLLYWRRAWPKAQWMRRLSGLTSPPLMVSRGGGGWTSFVVASRARTSALQERAPGLPTESVRASGVSLLGSFARWDQASCSWKTSALSLFEGSILFSGTWPRSGSMRNGACSERQTLAHHTSENDYSSWPTPRAEPSTSRNANNKTGGEFLGHAVQQWPTPMAQNWRSGSTGPEMMSKNSRPLQERAVSGWPTPRASDGEKGGPNQAGSSGDLMLTSAAAKWPTPTAMDSESSACAHLTTDSGRHSGTTLTDAMRMWPTPAATSYGSSQNGINGKGGEFERPSAGTPSLETLARNGELPSLRAPETPMAGGNTSPTGLILNPRFVEALMGFPIGWTD